MDTNDRIILRRLILALTLVVLIGVVVWMFFIRDTGKKTTTKKSGTTNTSQHTAMTQGTTQPASSSGSTAGGAQAQGNPQVAGSNTKQPDRLADTGPGNVAGLFASAVVVGGFARYLYYRRKPVSQA